MRHVYRDFLLAIALVAAALTAAAQTLADFPLKDGDVWVMAGDSITAQHLHSNYFEAFCFVAIPNSNSPSAIRGSAATRSPARWPDSITTSPPGSRPSSPSSWG